MDIHATRQLPISSPLVCHYAIQGLPQHIIPPHPEQRDTSEGHPVPLRQPGRAVLGRLVGFGKLVRK